MNTTKTKMKIYEGADEYFAETLKFKVKSNVYNNLDISVYGLYYGLTFKNHSLRRLTLTTNHLFIK